MVEKLCSHTQKWEGFQPTAMGLFPGFIVKWKKQGAKVHMIYIHIPTHTKKRGNKNIHICVLIERNTEIKTIS